MANNLYAHTGREAVRVKVKKCELNKQPEWRKFSVDPQITSLEVLYSLLAKAFDIKSDFSIKYKAFDPAGNEIYLAVLSDWDLDAAFLRIHNLSIQTATEPCLTLQIDIKPFTEVKEWDVETPSGSAGGVALAGCAAATSTVVVSPSYAGGGTGAREIISPLQQSLGVSQKYVQNMQTKLPGLIMNQMEKTFSIVQKAFNLSEETMATLPPRPPLADSEFRLFLDALGQVQRTDELRKVIFFGGIDPSLRRVVWKHILNVYPSGMNGRQRMDYMRRKSEHYYKLRETWKTAVKQGCNAGELSYVTSMVKKDVLRTDRLHSFYAGSDDNQNIAALFNILTTYALNHPTVSYCQGMSDIASPLLVTMNDEAQAYICFCAIMTRVKGNFMLDGIAMTQKFAHLTEALSFYDPEFWEYLKAQQADDLLFCYRWLLLELKREFPFDDALRMLEVQWSSLKYETSVDRELSLYEKEFVPILETSAPTTSSSLSSSLGAPPISPSYMLAKARENPYTKVCALRRQSSSASLSSLGSSASGNNANNALNAARLDATKRLNQSLDDNIPRHVARRQRHSSSKAHQSLDESKMLMLLEGIENIKDLDSSAQAPKIGNVVKGEAAEDDDDVFTNSNTEANQFNFHPTNPFIEDTQANSETLATATIPTPAIARVFLDSASSAAASPTEYEVGECGVGAQKVPQIPKGIAKLQNKNILSNYNTVSNIIAKQIANAATVSDSVKRVGSSGGGHFKDLKEKIAATSRKGMSFDDLNSGSNEKSQQKLVKNFNEFLSFAAVNKNRITDRFVATANCSAAKVYDKDQLAKTPSPTHLNANAIAPTHPLVQLTKSGFVSSLDESDSSSVPDTTWSGSTAATAIQQTNNLSSNSLHLELNSSLSSTAMHTPEKTPTCEQHKTDERPAYSATASPVRNLPNDPSLTPDDSQDQEYYPMTTAITRELRLEAENLDRQVYGDTEPKAINTSCDIEYEKLDKDSLELVEDLKENEIIACPDMSELLMRRRNRDGKLKNSNIAPLQLTADYSNASDELGAQIDSNLNVDETAQNAAALTLNPFIDDGSATELLAHGNLPNSHSLPEVIVPISTADVPDATPVELATNAADEIAFSKSCNPQQHQHQQLAMNGACSPVPATPTQPMLPSPAEFGGGNPFLIFLCLTLLLQHRNTVMKSGMDYNEIAMHFDKMVRKHDVTRVLNQARRMYIDYLKAQNAYSQRLQAAQLGTTSDINKNSASATTNATQSYCSTATKS